MAYCTSCGAAQQPRWQVCAGCSAPAAAGVLTTPPPPVSARPIPPAGPFASPAPGQASSPQRLSPVWVLAAALTLVAACLTLAAGAGLVVGVTLAWVGNHVADVGVVADGTQHAAPGFALGMIGPALALVATSLAAGAAVTEGGRLSARAAAPLWAMLAGVVGLAWAIGDAMNWEQTEVHATVAGYTFRATGTSTVTQSCCTLLDNHGWDLTGQIALVAAAVLVPLFAAAWRPVSFALTAGPLSSVVRLSAQITPASLGITQVQVHQGGLVVSRHGLLGLWLALLAVVVLVLVAVGRALHASVQG